MPRRWGLPVVLIVVVLAVAGGVTGWLLTRDSGGDSPPSQRVEGRLELGAAEPLAEGVIGPEGGEFRTPDGLTILVPAGAHTAEVDYRIERRQVLGSSFPTWIEPASPLYVVHNGGAQAADPIAVEITADIPAGGFGMALFYDETTGELSPMPLRGTGEGYVAAATTHFSSFVAVNLPGWGPGNPAQTSVDSGFRPGVDDWQFINEGSFAAPGGHCAGQSMSGMWYYVERALGGAPRLYGLYDNNGGPATGLFWPDDSQSYRLASSVQSDLEAGWQDRVLQTYLSYAGSAADQYTAFMAAMAITGNPQLVGMWPADPTQTGHAMIVYRGDASGLYVADPNDPGNSHLIPWNGVTLGPYDSAAYAAAQGTSYVSFAFLGVDALVNWPQITDRWAEFEAGVAGVGRFPTYQLFYDGGGGSWVPAGGGAAPPTNSLTLSADLGGVPWKLDAFDAAGNSLAGGQQDQPLTLDVGSSPVEIGVLIWGDAGGRWVYVDYVDLAVTPGGGSQPGTTQPGTTQPGTTQPGTTQPGTSQPGTSQPGTSQPTLPPVVGGDTSIGMFVIPMTPTGYHEASVGDDIGIHVSLSNDGPGSALNVSVSSADLPGCTRTIAQLGPSEFEDWDCTVTVGALGPNTYTVSATGTASDGSPLSATAQATVEGFDPALPAPPVTIEFDRLLVYGSATVTVTVTNTGSDTRAQMSGDHLRPDLQVMTCNAPTVLEPQNGYNVPVLDIPGGSPGSPSIVQFSCTVQPLPDSSYAGYRIGLSWFGGVGAFPDVWAVIYVTP